MRDFLSLERAQDQLLSCVTPLPAESLPLLQAAGRVLAGDYRAPDNLPSSPLAAVDGFALPEEEAVQESYALRRRLEEGDFPDFRLEPHQAVGVVTGGPLPDGTGRVIPQESALLKEGRVFPAGEVAPGDNIRQPGEDLMAGEVFARQGMAINPGLVGVMAAFGLKEVQVCAQPRVAIISLGREIVPHDRTPAPGQVRDCNGPLLAALVQRQGGRVVALEIANDCNPGNVRETLERLAAQADLLLTIGGTAWGEGDRASEDLRSTGARLLFWGVGIKPGSHSGAAVRDGRLLLSLSGNPAACAVGFHLLAAPVLRALQGLGPLPPRVPAVCSNSFPKGGGPRRFLLGCATWGQDGCRVTVLPRQKSSMLRSLVSYNSLIDLPAGHPPLEPGSGVTALLLHHPF